MRSYFNGSSSISGTPPPAGPHPGRPPHNRPGLLGTGRASSSSLPRSPVSQSFDDTAVNLNLSMISYHDIMIRKQHWKTCWSCPSFKTIPMWFMNNSRTRWTPPLTRWRVQERAPGRTWEATRASPGKDPLAVTPVTTSTTWTSTRTQTTHTYMWALWTLQYSCCVRFM